MATDKNTLKQWFKTGLKPTQEQFWAWLDSFWHKDETIPTDKIEGLSTILGDKADSSQLAGKADLINGKVPLSQLPFGDDVLNFDNFSAFPTTGEVGKFYIDLAEDKPYIWNAENSTYIPAGTDATWKATVDAAIEQIANKLDKPTATGTPPNYPYVVLVDDNNNSAKTPAGDLGKNIANTDMQIPSGVARTLDKTGARFLIKGLENKTGDNSFRHILKTNDLGELGITDEPQVVINLPDKINYTTGTPNINITITKVEQTISVPNETNFSEQIREVMKNLFNYDYTPYALDDYGLADNKSAKLDAGGYITGLNPVKLGTKKTFASNLDFIIKIENITGSCGQITALNREKHINSNEYVMGGDCNNGYLDLLYIKKGNILFVIGYIGDGNWVTKVFNFPLEFGYTRVLMSANKISYKIL